MNFNYHQICLSLLKDVPGRQKEVILRRFGLETGQRETLEAIGKSYSITRERVRQIEEDGFSKLKPNLGKYQKIFQYFGDHLKIAGNLKKEDSLLNSLGGERFRPQAFFLLTLGENFQRFSETKDLYSLWTIDPNSLTLAQKVINAFYNKLTKINQPLVLGAFNFPKSLSKTTLISYLEISKKIQQNEEGLFGLKDWPEINPKGVKDKAYLVFKKAAKPLHFTEVSNQIPGKALPQTVHNELIRDPRFVLVGRGLYALREWGYQSGYVKDIISKVLKEAQKPLSKEEIIKKVLKERLVKENTISLNLSNKKYFFKDSQEKYIAKET